MTGRLPPAPITWGCGRHLIAQDTRPTTCPVYVHGSPCTGTITQVAGPGLHTNNNEEST